MNILAIMGAHGVFYKDEPLRELDAALNLQGFQLLYPKNSDDLLKLIEHNPRISGGVFDWDAHNSPELCGEINQLNEYLPLTEFKRACDLNLRVKNMLPDLYAEDPDFYRNVRIQTLAQGIHQLIRHHDLPRLMLQAFDVLPESGN